MRDRISAFISPPSCVAFFYCSELGGLVAGTGGAGGFIFTSFFHGFFGENTAVRPQGTVTEVICTVGHPRVSFSAFDLTLYRQHDDDGRRAA